MGELHHEPFQFAFNGFLKVAFQGSRITSDAGLLLRLPAASRIDPFLLAMKRPLA